MGAEGGPLPSNAGDEPRNGTEAETGIPSAVPPPIRAQTYVDPYPTEGNRKKANTGTRLKKAATTGEIVDSRTYVPKHSLKIGKAASFAQLLKGLTEQELLARPGVPIRQILAEMLIEGALAGDKWCHEQIMDRTEGKPVQGLAFGQMTANPLQDLSEEQLANLRKMAALNAAREGKRAEIAKQVMERLNGDATGHQDADGAA